MKLLLLPILALAVFLPDWGGNVRISGTQGQTFYQDAATNTMVTTDYAHHELHDGGHYFNESFVDIPASDVVDIRFTTPNSAKWSHLLIVLDSQEECKIDLFESISIDVAGTDLIAHNSHRNSSKTSGWTAFDYIVNTSVANADSDTDTSGCIILKQMMIGSNQGNNSGNSRGDAELVLKQNTSYSLRIENEIANPRYITWGFYWYEHTNKN